MRKLLLQILLYISAITISSYILLGYLKLIPTNTTALIVMSFFGIFTCLLLGEIIGDERKNSDNKRV
jgi:hypothetical protein